jgi:hypothetical protein
MNKKLKNQIEKKLAKLNELLDQIEEARIINKEKDEFGEPLILETGLCSLMDDYQSEMEEEDE